MTKTQLLLSAALAGIMVSAAAQAADETAAAAPAKVKCYGIAKAGKNACASANGSHACMGLATADNDPNEFADATAEECEKAGGKTTAPEAPKDAPKE